MTTRSRRLLPALGRALSLRCPKCGTGRIFRRWLVMVEDCPGCGLHFERSPGYWLGAMTINLTVTMGAFLVVFIGVMVLTWPEVPWTGLMVAVVAVSVVTPLVVHPWSRLVWVAVERYFRMATEPDI